MLNDLFAAAVLIAALDANSFRAREAAHASLERMEMRAYPALVLARGRSAEQRRRLDLLRVRFNDLTADCLCGEAPPWIDALPDSGFRGLYLGCWRSEFFCAYVTEAREQKLRYRGPWPAYRQATRNLIGDLLSNGRQQDAEELILRLKKRCARWDGNSALPPETD